MVLKRVFIVGSLSFIFALQGWGQASGKHDTILANYELVQEFQEFTLGGKLSNNSLSIYPREINDTDNFWFDFQTTAGKDYYYVMPAAGKREPLFDKSKMAMQLSEFTKGVVDKNKLDISSIAFSKDQRSFEFDYKGKQYSYNRLTGKLTIVEKKEEKKESSDPSYTWMNFSPDKKYILYAKNHNLYVKGNKSLGVDTTEVQLTTDGMKDFSYAREDDYEPAEDGEVPTLARWCPDNRHVYAVRDDNRLLRDFWVINSIEDSPSLVKYKYEFPGDKYVTQNDLTIIDIVEKTAKKAKVEKWKDQYVMPLHVTSDSKYLFFERTKCTWDEVDVCSVNLSTLEVKEIIHEEDKPYRDPHARNVAILNDGKDILFRSERTGWGHYYHYDGDGNLKNVMTSGEWVTGYINSIDTLKRKVYLYGYGKDKKVNPFYYMLFEVDIDKEGVTPLSTEDGQHNVNFLKSHNYYIDTYSRVDMEPKIMLKDRKGKVIMELAKPDLDLVYASGWKKPERFVVKAADNITDLYGVMWKPSDFNPEKKYPIISVVYPGPYFGFVPTNFTLDDSYCTRMAQLGFIVITVGHRGDTPMRGKAYHRYGYGNMRDYPLADDKYAIGDTIYKTDGHYTGADNKAGTEDDTVCINKISKTGYERGYAMFNELDGAGSGDIAKMLRGKKEEGYENYITPDNVTGIIVGFNTASPNEGLMEYIANEWGWSAGEKPKQVVCNNIARALIAKAKALNIDASKFAELEKFINEHNSSEERYSTEDAKQLDSLINSLVRIVIKNSGV